MFGKSWKTKKFIKLSSMTYKSWSFGDIPNKISVLAAVIIFMAAVVPKVEAQNMAPAIEFNPRSYVCHEASDELRIDGKIRETSWESAEWTERFVDIEGEARPDPRFETKVKMLWDEQYFYIAAKMEEPHLWATLTERDAVLFYENNFEVFIDPTGDTHNYYELEVNALGTYWDLMLPKPYRDGGRAVDAWDIRGLKVGIDLEDTLNDPSDIDTGWTVELAIPWEVLEEAAPEGRAPEGGEKWRVNFSRVQWETEAKNGKYVKKSDTEDNWVWSPQGLVNMHYPEMWGYVQFVNDDIDSDRIISGTPGMQAEEQVKWYLRQLYYRQHDYRAENEEFAARFHQLKEHELRAQLKSQIDIAQWSNPNLHVTGHTFEISIEHLETGENWYIRENGLIWKK